jgi:hypothetical protein
MTKAQTQGLLLKGLMDRVNAEYKKHGFTRNQILGTLLLMSLPAGKIEKEWLEIMQMWKNRYEEVVEEHNKRINNIANGKPKKS